MITALDILTKADQHLTAFFLEKGFSKKKKANFELVFESGSYHFNVGISADYSPVSVHIDAIFRVNLTYVLDIFNHVLSINNRDILPFSFICIAKTDFFYHKTKFSYEVKSLEDLKYIVDEIAFLVSIKGLEFFKTYTDIRKIELEVNRTPFINTQYSFLPGDLAEKAILALILAKLCRPASVEALAVQYRDTLYNDAFYLNRYDPAVEYLLKTDIGSYRHIQPPF